jgi:arginine N-succinyltransferase
MNPMAPSGSFRIREARPGDDAALLELAKMVYFINLPPDRDIIRAKIDASQNAFLKAAGSRRKPADASKEPVRLEAASDGVSFSGTAAQLADTELFMFILEDVQSGGVLGTSQVITRMGGPGNPQVSLKLSERQYYSESLKYGSEHTVAELHLDESGPSELGGLILLPSLRNHAKKLGWFLSMVRFHIIGLHRKRFADRVLAEMMAPITPDGRNLVWEALGRRFIPLSYDEADRFCQYSREFMITLLPRDPIHLSLLPPTVRQNIGEVGEATKPARRMLEKLGFEFRGFVDPFDGGPYLDCDTAKIEPVKNTSRMTLAAPAAPGQAGTPAIVSVLDKTGEFRAVQEAAVIAGQDSVALSAEAAGWLQAEPGASVGVTTFPKRATGTRRLEAASTTEK